MTTIRPRPSPASWMLLLLTLPTLLGAAPAALEPATTAPVLAADETLYPRWQWPLIPQPAVARAYDPPPRPWMPGHRGVDLEADPGQSVLAPTAGTISFSGMVAGRQVITLTTDEGYKVSFEPIADPLPRGTTVAEGQPIARRDPDRRHEGCGECLHVGVRWKQEYMNPLLFFTDLAPSVLWPLP